ncbi:hypothetical protein B6U74_04620 [Candidatus Bathyarchaeota archaeon ex4484_205]|nr:MAG: hypothetical protein B6U74_04620 [Candidatus Bathyarchaeota archaeon ex4484_205]
MQNDLPILSLCEPINKPKSGFISKLENNVSILTPTLPHAAEYVNRPDFAYIHIEGTTGAIMSCVSSHTLDGKYEEYRWTYADWIRS